MARDEARRRASREADKLRKRARRERARLEKLERGAVGSRKADLNARITQLDVAIQQSKAQRGRPVSDLNRAAIRELEKLAPKTRSGARARSNRIMREQINLASGGELSSLGPGGAFKSSAFYQATKNLWKDENGVALPAPMRNRAIMEKLGVSTLEEAYRIIEEQNPEAFRKAEELGRAEVTKRDTEGKEVSEYDGLDARGAYAEVSTRVNVME